MDFPVTRAIIELLPRWVNHIAADLPIPTEEPDELGGFRWSHPQQDYRTLLVTKAVRIVSGLRAAMILADSRHSVESATLLRTVSDFNAEVEFICEGVLEGRFTTDQSKFIDQHHAPLASTPEEFAARERERYVGRKDIAKAQRRLAERPAEHLGEDASADIDPDELAKLAAFLNHGYDAYVHGKYQSAMELFSARTRTFMMAGTESLHNACVAKVSAAGKLGEALISLGLMATVWRLPAIAAQMHTAFQQLNASGEDLKDICT